MIEAWAGQKSFQPKPSWDDRLKPPPPSDPGSNPTIDFRKQKRSNETHQSLTDRFARLFKKSGGSEAKLGYLGHVVTENRNGLVVDVRLTQATGTAERDAAVEMLRAKAGTRRITLGADRGYDTADFVKQLRALQVTPHVAQNDTNRSSAVDERTARHEGYRVSQRKRKRVEEVFGWMKTVALQRKTRFRGPDRVGWMFTLAAAAYNLVRMRNLQAVNTEEKCVCERLATPPASPGRVTSTPNESFDRIMIPSYEPLLAPLESINHAFPHPARTTKATHVTKRKQRTRRV